jgi:hypothetical protein
MLQHFFSVTILTCVLSILTITNQILPANCVNWNEQHLDTPGFQHVVALLILDLGLVGGRFTIPAGHGVVSIPSTPSSTPAFTETI